MFWLHNSGYDDKIQWDWRTTGRIFAEAAGTVVGPEYREEPVNGSPYDGVDWAEGVGDWAATYLDPPVKGSAYCEGALSGAEPAELRYLDAPNNTYLIMDMYGLECLRMLTSVRIYIFFPTCPNINTCRILLDKFDDFVYVCQWKFVALQKSLSGAVRVFWNQPMSSGCSIIRIRMEATRDIVRQFKWWYSILDIDIEYIIVFLPLV